MRPSGAQSQTQWGQRVDPSGCRVGFQTDPNGSFRRSGEIRKSRARPIGGVQKTSDHARIDPKGAQVQTQWGQRPSAVKTQNPLVPLHWVVVAVGPAVLAGSQDQHEKWWQLLVRECWQEIIGVRAVGECPESETDAQRKTWRFRLETCRSVPEINNEFPGGHDGSRKTVPMCPLCSAVQTRACASLAGGRAAVEFGGSWYYISAVCRKQSLESRRRPTPEKVWQLLVRDRGEPRGVSRREDAQRKTSVRFHEPDRSTTNSLAVRIESPLFG